MTLRARLVLTLIALTTLGLLGAGLLINNQLRDSLLDRLDSQLVSLSGPMSVQLSGNDPENGSRGPRPGPLASAPIGTYGSVFTTTGTTVTEVQLSFAGRNGSAITSSTTVYSRPDITPAQVSAALSSTTGRPTFISVPGAGSISSFRVMLTPVGDVVLAVAVPQTELNATLSQLLVLELAVGIAILAALAIFAYLIIRREMRPLEQMSATASKIAAGDLSQRVDESHGGSEVGQLGSALNVMLSRIEVAFAQNEASQERLRQFVADASHELRTPLTSIRGYAEMYERGAACEPADLNTVMTRISQESIRMSVLVDDLLLLARLDQQRSLRREHIYLGPLITEVVLDANAAYPDHHIEVATATDVATLGDESAIRQVLVNLTANACVHTPAHTPIAVSLSSDKKDAVITVVDSGPGVPAELAPEVFTRFTRAEYSRARDSGGSGLGLSIVEAIVKAHEGSVVLTQTRGGGATFLVRLPLSTA